MHLRKQDAQPLVKPYRTVTVKGKPFLIDDEDFSVFEASTWNVNSHGYLIGRGKRPPLFHRVIMGEPRGMAVDHINRKVWDNRRCNLRVCTRAENAKNRGIGKNNTTGYKGVYRHFSGKYRCIIVPGKKFKHIGMYETPQMAALAYDAAAIQEFGAFAGLNFPRGQQFTLQEVNDCIIGNS